MLQYKPKAPPQNKPERVLTIQLNTSEHMGKDNKEQGLYF